MANCGECTRDSNNIFQCLACDEFSYFDETGICQKCSDKIVGCETCSFDSSDNPNFKLTCNTCDTSGGDDFELTPILISSPTD